MSKYHLILASRSPRRQQLLKDLGLCFKVRNFSVIEQYPPHLSPPEVALNLADLKLNVIASQLSKNELLIAADTIVILNKKILGKPKNRKEALSMLNDLSGKKHEVITGVSILYNNIKKSFTDSTFVFFDDMTDQEIIYYVDKYKPYDKAGAYGIQEWISYVGIKRIEGSYHNVMGLPVQKLYKLLQTVR